MTRRGILLLIVLSLSAVVGCQQNEAVQFGAVLPLTGSAAIYGQSIHNGLQLAEEQLGSRTSRAITLTIVDSGSSPEQAAAAADELYSDGAWAVIGGVTTAEAMEMVPVADEAGGVLLSPSASSPELTGISENFYRVFPSDFHEGTKMGNFAAQTLQLQTAAILAAEGPYGIGVQQVFAAEFERNGGEVVENIEFPVNTSDFSGLLDRVMTLNPQGVYLAAFADEVTAMILGLREREYGGTILTTHAFASTDAIARAGQAATGVFLTQSAFEIDIETPENETPEVREFVEAYQAKFGVQPDIYAAHGYDALMVLVQSLEQGVVTRGDLWKGVRSLRNYQGVTGAIQFDERGDVQKFPRVYVINAQGRLLNYEAEVGRRRKELLERLRALDEERQATPTEGG